MRSSATTNPLPTLPVPHEGALPVIRTTDWAACVRAGESSATCGMAGAVVGTPTASMSRGRPSVTIVERNCARKDATGRGVRSSSVRRTLDDAIAWVSTGAPSDCAPNASNDTTMRVTATLTDGAEHAVDHPQRRFVEGLRMTFPSATPIV